MKWMKTIGKDSLSVLKMLSSCRKYNFRGHGPVIGLNIAQE